MSERRFSSIYPFVSTFRSLSSNARTHALSVANLFQMCICFLMVLLTIKLSLMHMVGLIWLVQVIASYCSFLLYTSWRLSNAVGRVVTNTSAFLWIAKLPSYTIWYRWFQRRCTVTDLLEEWRFTTIGFLGRSTMIAGENWLVDNDCLRFGKWTISYAALLEILLIEV